MSQLPRMNSRLRFQNQVSGVGVILIPTYNEGKTIYIFRIRPLQFDLEKQIISDKIIQKWVNELGV